MTAKFLSSLASLAALMTFPMLHANQPVVGLLMKDGDIFYAAVQQGAEEAASGHAQLIVKAPTVANSLQQQKLYLGLLAKEPLDALVIAPLVTEEFSVPVQALAAKGVKIVAIDTPLPEGIAQTYIGYNQREMAEAAGAYIVNLIGENDEVAILRANSLETVSVREKTLIDHVKARGQGVTLHVDILSGAKKGDEYEQSILMFSRHPEVDVIITPFSASSMAMIQLIKERGLGGKVTHIGFGTGLPAEVEEALEQGRLQAWVAQQPRLIGKRGVEAALELIQGKELPAQIDVEFVIVTKDNLHSDEVKAIR